MNIDAVISINGKELTLPCNYSDFISVTDKNSKGKYEYIMFDMTKPDDDNDDVCAALPSKLAAYSGLNCILSINDVKYNFSIFNLSDSETNLSDYKVYSISVEECAKEHTTDVKIMNKLDWNMTMDEVTKTELKGANLCMDFIFGKDRKTKKSFSIFWKGKFSNASSIQVGYYAPSKELIKAVGGNIDMLDKISEGFDD